MVGEEKARTAYTQSSMGSLLRQPTPWPHGRGLTAFQCCMYEKIRDYDPHSALARAHLRGGLLFACVRACVGAFESCGRLETYVLEGFAPGVCANLAIATGNPLLFHSGSEARAMNLSTHYSATTVMFDYYLYFRRAAGGRSAVADNSGAGDAAVLALNCHRLTAAILS